ncbi:fatty-acid--CoA ligase FadD1 [Nocardioides daeguensis]|uniref:Fatty-acid--CoA ligase FadD1 n=1 Tax=Nocardioides daeguensis TaxID=908359 RepID=A0ABP6W9G6_9ACTN|nr:fatty-acid--CoA ligase FadD1 [Nocardioides daeguensis]MBV6727860.1 fatty-acid--CoA ligase FadD1 [Nocardioides daeguensis]MCR1775331.1 fatty-acid--CoA ligase FadD1 [Nocardioides daeguensis]
MADTVQGLLLAHAERDTAGLRYDERTWTWREVVAGAAARAHVLRAMADEERPLHVGVLLPNGPEMALAISAGAIGGHVTVGINGTRRGGALASDVRRADCQVVLTDSAHRPLLEGLDLGGATVVDTDAVAWPALVAAAPTTTDGFPVATTTDTFMLIFTSGTSGEPKAVQVANFMVVMAGSVLVDKYGLGPDDVVYCSMPMFHSNAVMAGFAVSAASGAALAVAEFSARGFLADVRRHGATYLNYVGKPLAYVLATPAQPDDADNPLRFAFGNEASDRDIREFAQRFGCSVWDGFGSTESAIIITRTEETPAGSIGVPFDGVAVYDRGTRTECPRAEYDAEGRVTNLDEAVGELVNTQGAGFFAGYYNDDEATAERLDGGMYWSGDLAYRDADGFVFLAGRTDDWLRVDGENLAAAPVEQLLLRHEAISQAAVYAVTDERVGDQLMCALVLREGATLAPEELAAFLAAQPDLSPKGWPRHVRIAKALPSTATNKVLKRELRAQGLATADLLWSRGERDHVYAEQVRSKP